MALKVIIQWIHIVGGVLWVGGSVMLELLVDPAACELSLRDYRRLRRSLVPKLAGYFGVLGTIVILTGVVRGTLLGRVRSVAALATPYGLTFLGALVVVSGISLWGALVLGRGSARVFEDDRLWPEEGEGLPARRVFAARGTGAARSASGGEPDLRSLAAALGRLRLQGAIQIAAFGVVIVAMVLMGELFG